VVKSVYAASSKLTDYTATLIWQYKKIANIVGDRAFGDGVLNTTQKEAMKPDAANPDKDVTSTYNTGYLKAVNLLNEIAESVNNNSVYYEQRAKTQKAIAEAQNKGLSLVLKDDVYYSELYRRKCDEADAIQKLLYNAAKARTDKEREEYVKEYQNTDWIIVDENFQVDSDLRSALVVTRKGLETTYQRVDWNTSLIGEDEKSNTSDTAYQLFPLKSNFCLCVAGNTATVVPMGTQRDVSVASLNKNIKEQLEATGITEIENVIYGSLADIENAGSDYDVLLFSGEGKKGQANPWFMIAFKQEGKDITIDTSNITGYYGTYKTSDDPHFLEYEHSTITGMNQFASTTLEEGYQLYNVSLKTDGGEITKDTGASSISGSFFNSWSRSDGMVVLLGFTQEDKVIESTEYTTATVDTEEGNTTTTVAAKSENGVTTTVEGTTEETSEPETRAINEDDIYDANIYVLKYDTKAAVGEAAKNVTDSSAVNYAMGDLFDAGIELEGPFGELLQGPVNLLTLALRAVFALAYALGVLYCVYLGLKLSKAKDAAEREKAKLHIKWFIIAVIGTHILIVFMYLAKTQLTQWHYSVTEVTTTVTDK
jgi:hypothetical protein